jgi:mannose-6-phosphate isomerase
MLYPFLFKPIFFEKVWGANRLTGLFGKNCQHLGNCGESWEVSGLENKSTIIENGFLAGNELCEIVEIYMEDLVGEDAYGIFGATFPLLVKFIDTSQYLSLQVHPEGVPGKVKNNGKAEMWYVLNAEPEAEIIVGFNRKINKEEFIKHLENKTVKDILNVEKPKAGDVYFIPPGTIHAIGSGVTLIEIQQTSDTTYRVYDWDRVDAHGNTRELHKEMALQTIDFNSEISGKIPVVEALNQSVNIIQNKFFTANILAFNKNIKTDYVKVDSFVILCCVEGNFELISQSGSEYIEKGRCVLLPAETTEVEFVTTKFSKIIEVYI